MQAFLSRSVPLSEQASLRLSDRSEVRALENPCQSRLYDFFIVKSRSLTRAEFDVLIASRKIRAARTRPISPAERDRREIQGAKTRRFW